MTKWNLLGTHIHMVSITAKLMGINSKSSQHYGKWIFLVCIHNALEFGNCGLFHSYVSQIIYYLKIIYKIILLIKIHKHFIDTLYWPSWIPGSIWFSWYCIRWYPQKHQPFCLLSLLKSQSLSGNKFPFNGRFLDPHWRTDLVQNLQAHIYFQAWAL